MDKKRECYDFLRKPNQTDAQKKNIFEKFRKCKIELNLN